MLQAKSLTSHSSNAHAVGLVGYCHRSWWLTKISAVLTALFPFCCTPTRHSLVVLFQFAIAAFSFSVESQPMAFCRKAEWFCETHSLTRTLTRTHTHAHTQTHSHTHTHTHTQTHSHTYTHTLNIRLFQFPHTHTHTHTLTHTHTHTQTHTYYQTL